MNKKTLTYLFPAILAASLMTTTVAYSHDEHRQQQAEPVTMLIDFQIASSGVSADSTGTPYYIVGGPGYAPKRIFRNGEISDKFEADHEVALLEGAQITFSGEPTDAVVKFTCLAGSCKMKFNDGSVLISNAGVPLEGRAINMWGPVYKSPDFDPNNQIMPIRIMGCGGLKEVAGKGRLANMVGSVCFNGVLNFNMVDPTMLTGSSKCTITMHTPIDPTMIP
jgi:hypothetical protein